MPTVTIDRIASHYEISGSGPPILLESQPPDYIRDWILDLFATHASVGVHA